MLLVGAEFRRALLKPADQNFGSVLGCLHRVAVQHRVSRGSPTKTSADSIGI
jgi:hypothetical protein